MDSTLRRVNGNTWRGRFADYVVDVSDDPAAGWSVAIMSFGTRTRAVLPATSLDDGACVARDWIGRHGPAGCQ
jgi:hypothetical protein